MAIRNNSSDSSSSHRRFALIIANSKHDDPDLQNLAAAGQDAEALSSVLKNIDIGGFEVKILKNEPSYKVNEEIETFFSDRYRDDLLLLYFSCHGIKDIDGRLYYATINTRRKLLASTAVSANFVNEAMLRSLSRRQMLMIDCCYGGAFARGMHHKADKVVHTGEQFEGRGRIVLTASDSMQYSFEGDRREGVGERSVFTHAVIRGLETGEADIDKNGLVSYTELYNYAYDRVIDETPMQKPGMWVFGLEGDVVVAKNPYKKKVEEKSAEEQDPNDLILDAAENLKRGDFNSTIAYSDKAIKINPRFAVAYNIKGSALFNLRQYHEALMCYERALQLRPNYIEAINNRGIALAAIGDYNKATECFNQSTELNPIDSIIWNHKGLAFHALGKYEDAVGSFDKAISLNPTYTEALNNKELSSSQLKKKTLQQEPQEIVTDTTDDSISDTKIKKDFTDNQTVSESAAPIGTHIGALHPSSSTPEAMEKEHIPSDIPKSKGVISSRSTFSPYIAPQQETHSSTTESKKLQRDNIKNIKILVPIVAVIIGAVIAFVVFGSGIMQQAPPPVNQPSPQVNQPSALVEKGNALYNQSNYAQAIQYYDKALAIDPNYEGALYGKGIALDGSGNHAQAVQYFDKALAIAPNDKDNLYGKGNALYSLGNYTQAIQYYDKVLAIDPNYEGALYGKGIALDSLGNYTQAVQYYDKALAIDPNDKEALNGKQNALSKNGSVTSSE